MKPGARIAAAIEVLDQIVNRYRPASDALNDWGKAHRFAGSGDRNAIGGLVYDALRTRGSSAFLLGEETPRAYVIGSLAYQGATAAEVSVLLTGEDHTPPPLSDSEMARLTAGLPADAPPSVKGDYPEWLHGSLSRVFGDRVVEECRAMSARAPADLRVNTLKATPEKVLSDLASLGATPAPFVPEALRIAAPVGGARIPNLQAEEGYQQGWFEIQDVGSQIAAALACAGTKMQVLDLCAGGGGKTLALAAHMENKGQIYVYDADRTRLKPIFERINRAGVRNQQVLRAGDRAALTALGPRFDVVLVDAPCTGTGTWRRRPDAKWRLKAPALADRQKQQREVLDLAQSLVKPGGRIVYVTCSLLPEENTDQVAAFLARAPGFRIVPYGDAWRAALPGEPPVSADARTETLLLTPASHDTDGFFVAVLVSGA